MPISGPGTLGDQVRGVARERGKSQLERKVLRVVDDGMRRSRGLERDHRSPRLRGGGTAYGPGAYAADERGGIDERIGSAEHQVNELRGEVAILHRLEVDPDTSPERLRSGHAAGKREMTSPVRRDHRLENFWLRLDIDAAIRQLSEQLFGSQPRIDRIVGCGRASAHVRDPDVTAGIRAEVPRSGNGRGDQRHEMRGQL